MVRGGRAVGELLVDVVVPIFGARRGCLHGYLGPFLRGCSPHVRVVLMSSKSSRPAHGVLYSLTSRYHGRVRIVCRRGKKRGTTQGTNVRVSRTRCVRFLSDSSCVI